MRAWFLIVVLVACFAAKGKTQAFRPPAVPLVTHDPYLSIWSEADRLTDDATRHWTRAKHSLVSLIAVDDRTYRLMGDEPKDVAPMEQDSVTVTPTRTLYRFHSAEIAVTLTFLTPALPDDLEVLARPLTYITWSLRSTDGKAHRVSVFFSASGELAVFTPDQKVVGSRVQAGAITALRIGSEEQPVLERAGDDTRIDWGYAYAAPMAGEARSALVSQADALKAFVGRTDLPTDDTRGAVAVKDDAPVLAFVLPLGEVSATATSRTMMLAYDDDYSILYFGKRLKGYWKRKGMTIEGLLQTAARDYPNLNARCAAFDRELEADLDAAGGPGYAKVCALAYRQCLAGCKLAADGNGMPMVFPKENTSNGCIGTVDVIYPMDPFFLLFGSAFAKATLAPVLNYTASPLWQFKYAPHDLGTYPHATRQVYGSDDPAHEGDRMPVEESGNMIVLLAAIAKQEGNADFASRYWTQVTTWANYLESKGFDPENQLCTDDFTGHLAHNANLSAKAIEALAAYGMLCEMRGDRAAGTRYQDLAKQMAAKWVAAADDGDHFRLAFDKPGTWSQKYNLVWDRILGLNVFPPDAIRKEMSFYLKTKDRYGLALDNRQPYAKIDWSLWTATMAENQAGFRALVDPIAAVVSVIPERNPITDLYWTKKGSEVGMHARPVVGGLFIKMLSDPAMWKKWAARGQHVTGSWAALPTPPKVSMVVQTSEKAGITWSYAIERPVVDWFEPRFDASAWKTGPGGFGAAGTPGINVNTEWRTDDIWCRRAFEMPAGSFKNLNLYVYHDEDVEVYINGVLAGRASGFVTAYVAMPIRPAALAALKPGKNTLAVHCHQTEGGQGVDVGIVNVEEKG